jgi:hypothetical protein
VRAATAFIVPEAEDAQIYSIGGKGVGRGCFPHLFHEEGYYSGYGANIKSITAKSSSKVLDCR